MKKKNTRIFMIILILFFAVIITGINSIYGDPEGKIKVFLKSTTGKTTFENKSDLDALAIRAEEEDFGEIIDLGYDYILMEIWVEAIDSGTYYLDEFSSQVDFNEVIVGLDGDSSSENGWGMGSSPRGKGNVIGYAADGQKLAATRKGTAVKIGTTKIEYNKLSSLTDFSIDVKFYQKISYYDNSKRNGDLYYFYEGDITYDKVIIGNPNSGPDASLKTLNVKGASGSGEVNYAEGDTRLDNDLTIPVTITYKDSKSKLVITSTPKKGSATESVVDPFDPVDGYSNGNEIVITRTDGTDTKTYTIIITVTPINTDNALSALKAIDDTTGLQVTFEEGAFNPTIKAYTVKIPYTTQSVSLTATKKEALATIDAVSKVVSFNTTEIVETIKTEIFTVTSESGETNTYTVSVVREAANTDTGLKNVIINGNAGANSVIATISGLNITATLFEVSNTFKFSAEPTASTSKVTYSFDGTNFKPLATSTTLSDSSSSINKGNNFRFTIKVTAESGDFKTYSVEVNRPLSSNTDLDSVVIEKPDKSTIPLSANGTKYTYTIDDATISSLKVLLTPKAGENARVELLKNGELKTEIVIVDLVKGDNIYTIRVIPENGGTPKDYELNIKKLDDAKDILETTLQDINKSFAEVATYTKNANTYAYVFTYSKASNVRLNIKSSDNSTITSSTHQFGQSSFDNDKYIDLSFTNITDDKIETISITVTAENGTYIEYTFSVKRSKADTNNKLTDLQVNGIQVKNFNQNTTDYTDVIVFSRDTSVVTVTGIASSLIAKVQYKVGNSSASDNGTVNLQPGVKTQVDIIVTPESGAANSLTYKIYIIAASDENEILTLTLDGITMVPLYDKGTSTYKISVAYSVKTTKVIATASANATISGIGDWNLNQGLNTKTIYATSESGKQGQNYVIEITRNNPDSNDFLKTLIIKDKHGKVIFSETETVLQSSQFFNNNGKFYIVAKDVDYVEISATTSSNLAKITSALGKFNLLSAGESENKIVVTVSSEAGGNPRSYEVIIKRGDNDTDFDSITIGTTNYLKTQFDQTTRTITVAPNVAFNIASLDVVISRNQTVATVIATGAQFGQGLSATWNLNAATNTLTFRMKSEIGNEGDVYTVVINKDAAKKENSIAGLEVIANGKNLLEGTSIDFKTTTIIPTFRIDRTVTQVTVIVKILSTDGSSIRNRGTKTKTEGLYDIYEFNLNANVGATWFEDIAILAQDATMNTNPKTYRLNFVSKNADIDLEDIEIVNHNFDFANPNYTLGTFTVNDNKLTVNIVKKDIYSRIFYGNNEIGKEQKTVTLTIDLEEGTGKSFSFIIKTDVLNSNEHSAYAEKTYTFTYDKAKASSTAELDTLKVVIDGKTYDIALVKGTLSYELLLDRTFIGKSAEIKPTAKDFGKVGSKTITLKEKDNNELMIVTAQNNNDTANYYLNINVRSNKASIITFTIKDLDFIFDAAKQTVTGTPNIQNLSQDAFTFSALNKGKLEITITFEDQHATLHINGETITNKTSHTFTYQMEATGNLETLEFDIISEDGKLTKSYTLGYTRNEALTENKLKDLKVKIDNKDVVINFSPETGEYELKTERDAKEIELIASVDPLNLSKVNGDGKHALIAGDKNDFIITVTAEDGTSKDYKIIVYPQSDEVEVLNISFDKLGVDSKREVVDYQFDKTATIPFELGQYAFTDQKIKVTVEKLDANSILLVDGSELYNESNKTISFEYTLKLGKNPINIGMKSEYDKTTKAPLNYVFNYEQLKASNETVLKTISVKVDGVLLTTDVDGKNLTAPYERTINLRVDRINESKVIEINGVTADFNGSIESGGNFNMPLKSALNTFSIVILAEDKTTRGTYVINVYVADDVNEITNIKIHGKDVTPGFESGILSYTVAESFKWNINEVRVDVTAVNNSMNITGKGSQIINYNNTTLVVTSRSEYRTLINDSSKDLKYEITVTRDEPYKDINLNDLIVSDQDDNVLKFAGVSPVYKEGTYVYTVQLDKDKEFIGVTIKALVKDVKQKIKSMSGEDLFNNADNTEYIAFMVNPIREIYKFKVVAEDGAEREYTINITQGTTIGSDFSIQSVVLRDFNGTINYLIGDKAFDPAQLIYNISVSYKVNAVELEAIPSDRKAVVTGNGQRNLVEKVTKIEFFVTAENGTSGPIYTINITRNEPSKDALLKELKVIVDGKDVILGDLTDGNIQLEFNPTEFIYELKLTRSSKSVRITALANDPNAQVVGDLKVALQLEAGVNRYSVTVNAEDTNSVERYNINITVKNSEISIENLEVDGYNDFTYDPATIEYKLNDVNSTVVSINIIATLPQDSYGTISGSGTRQLRNGLNTFIITATSEDKSKTVTYTIKVTKTAPSNDALLKELKIIVDGKEIILGLSTDNPTQKTFDSETFEYDFKLTRLSKYVNITAIANDTKANVTTLPNFNRQLTLKAGLNTYTVTVVSEDGSVTELYTLNIEVANSDIEITQLEVDGHTLDYKQTELTYDLGEVEASIQNVDIRALIPQDSYGTLKGTGRQLLIEGKNTFIVSATSEDGSQTVSYTIHVTRKKGNNNAPANNDAKLYDLSVKGFVTGKEYITYDEATKTYTVTLDYTDTHAVIKPVANPLSTITGNGDGNHSVLPGETKEIKLQVTSSDGTKGEIYTVNLTRKQGDSSTQLNRLFIAIDGQADINLDLSLDYQEVTIDNGITKIRIDAEIPANSKITFKGLGAKVTQLSEQIFIVEVIPEAGESKTYVIKVLKGESDADLLSLDVLDINGNSISYDPMFDPAKLTYNIDLTDKPEVTTIEIFAVANSKKIKSLTGNGVFVLKSGTGETTDRYYIDVIAEDNKTTKRYTVIIKRNIKAEDDISIDEFKLHIDANVYLSQDTKDGVTVFTPDKKTYTISVPYSSLKAVLVFKNENGARLNGKTEYTLTDKQTTIIFSITSQSGKVTSENYAITIVKEDPSTDNKLKSLAINGTLVEGFDPDKLDYEITVDEDLITDVLIGAVANDIKALVNGAGKISLVKGSDNVVRITVTAEDGSKLDYTVTIKSVSFNANLSELSVVDYEILPIFDKVHINYQVRVPYGVTMIEIHALAENSKAVVNGAGVKRNLNVGSNIFTVYATAQSGKQGTRYQVEVIQEEPNKDTTLKSLLIKDKQGNVLSFESIFMPSVKDYVIIVPEDANIMSVVVEAEKNNKKQTIYGAGNQRLDALIDGKYHTVLKVSVEAESGDIGEYTISIYRGITFEDIIDIEDIQLIGSDNKVYFDMLDFDSKVLQYTVTVPYFVTNTNLEVKTVGRVSGAGRKDFGTQTQIVYTFRVISQSTKKMTDEYTITIKQEKATTENQLTNLTIDGVQVPNFSPEVTAYQMSIPVGSKTQILLGATAQSNTTITGTGTKELKLGTNVFTVNVTAQDGTINAYTVTINYVSNNAMLESLEVKGTNQDVFNKDTAKDFLLPADFDNTVLKHKVIVDKDVKKVQLTGTTQDQQGARVAGFLTYDFPLSEQSKTVYVEVTSGTGEKLVYEIELVRKDKLNSNSDLMNLTVGGRELAFNSKTHAYNLNVDNHTKTLNLSAETFDPNSTITVRGYSNATKGSITLPIDDLANGQNVIIVEVTAEDGTQSLYTLTVVKDAPQDMLFLILLIASLLLWIITVLILLAKRNKNKRDESNQVVF